ncbi:hypothetical protein V7128_07455 [Neobacillus vireti]|uniref:hypothetical protein n=1 Tax=Neobacillus vireti TaxID=220686 RepID=UPI002FFEB4B6
MAQIIDFPRFREPDHRDEPKILKYCVNCDAELYEGQDVTEFDGEYFCDDDCCHKYYDIKTVTLEEEY